MDWAKITCDSEHTSLNVPIIHVYRFHLATFVRLTSNVHLTFKMSGPEAVKFLEYDLILRDILHAPNRTRTQDIEVIKVFHTHSRTSAEYKTTIYLSKL